MKKYVCQLCHKPFESFLYTSKFCSTKCRSRGSHPTTCLVCHGKFISSKLDFGLCPSCELEKSQCEICSGEMPKYSRKDGTLRKTCNQTCHNRRITNDPKWRENQSKKVRGRRSPFWIDGRWRPFRGPQRQWNKTRKQILERDNYTCQQCQKSLHEIPRQAHIHHKVPWRVFVKKYGESEAHIYANRLSNLVCLCSSCHSKLTGNKK